MSKPTTAYNLTTPRNLTAHGELFAADGSPVHVTNAGAIARALALPQTWPDRTGLPHAVKVAAINRICEQSHLSPSSRALASGASLTIEQLESRLNKLTGEMDAWCRAHDPLSAEVAL